MRSEQRCFCYQCLAVFCFESPHPLSGNLDVISCPMCGGQKIELISHQLGTYIVSLQQTVERLLNAQNRARPAIDAYHSVSYCITRK